ncbi:replication initiation and membrane attachment family protein [Lacticaseibacillus jixianensis]|uniref:Replication initiation and membrane attachment family protein n=1 Tax=Lacticaseibacillus jixianensis TaxID=2486012 RepID=A0ABW4B769_9LACO|nr:replication initiation protein [Lacticaseibacillus jixianensis]
MARPTNYMAQDDYIVLQATYFSDQDQDVVVHLYQPLIGPVALALYLSLWNDSQRAPTASARRKQTALMDLLGVDLDVLYDARVRLEALGLMRTYTTTDASGRYYAYELYRPVEADAFFQDATLSLLLFDRVGQARYSALANRYAIHTVRAQSWQEVSAHLLDVFTLTAVAPPKPTTAASQSVQQKALPQVTLSDGAGYDWELLEQLCTRAGVKPGEIAAHRATLAQLATFYGLTPPVFARLIQQATSRATGTLAERTLRQIVEQTYQKQAPHLRPRNAAQPAAPAAQQPTGPLTVSEQQLVQEAKQTPPREFLELAKHRKSPQLFVASNEEQAVAKLASRNVFDSATINVLIDYVLQNYDSVTQALLDNIANRWLAAGVDSPERALQAIKDYEQQKRQPRQRRAAPARQEAKPAWLDQPYESKKAEDPAKNAEIAAKIAQLRALRKDDSDETHE